MTTARSRLRPQTERDDHAIDTETYEKATMSEEARDDAWLLERTHLLREMHFADVAQGYPIVTRFGIRARYRFGSIAARDKKSVILVNHLFADLYVPTFVVDGTLAHELAHYAHGFGSGLPRLYDDPHRGGVVDKELEKRGLGEVNAKAEQWRKAYWDAFYTQRCADIVARHAARSDRTDALWDTVLLRPDVRTEEELQKRFARVGRRFGFDAEDLLPFEVEWLRATRRQQGLSYWFAREGVLRLHGLLADRRVPEVVVDFELAYWLARLTFGAKWETVHRALCRADLVSVAEDGLRWRRHAWTAFRNRHHPLL
jgi:hypothetical protein